METKMRRLLAMNYDDMERKLLARWRQQAGKGGIGAVFQLQSCMAKTSHIDPVTCC